MDIENLLHSIEDLNKEVHPSYTQYLEQQFKPPQYYYNKDKNIAWNKISLAKKIELINEYVDSMNLDKEPRIKLRVLLIDATYNKELCTTADVQIKNSKITCIKKLTKDDNNNYILSDYLE